MRKILILLSFYLSSLAVTAQMKWNSIYQSYVDQYKDLAIEQMLKYNIPASITLAQGLFESGAGRSRLARLGNNHFGIKCHGWTGKTIAEKAETGRECFRAYDNALQSYDDHSRFICNNTRYSSLFKLDRTDYKAWAKGLRACGYATNSAYANKLIGIIELYKLYQYDRADSYDHFMARHSAKDVPVRKGASLHPIYLYNKNYYLRARKGDTFNTIAEEVGISAHRIARYNERDTDDPLTIGEVIYLKKKQKRADKKFEMRPHRVKPGESMYSIAQQYGIRTKSLYKMNHLQPSYQIKVGDSLIVY